MSELWKEINSDIHSREKTGPSVFANLATIVNELWHNPLEKNKFVNKLEAYPKPENCKNLIVMNKSGSTSLYRPRLDRKILKINVIKTLY